VIISFRAGFLRERHLNVTSAIDAGRAVSPSAVVLVAWSAAAAAHPLRLSWKQLLAARRRWLLQQLLLLRLHLTALL